MVALNARSGKTPARVQGTYWNLKERHTRLCLRANENDKCKMIDLTIKLFKIRIRDKDCHTSHISDPNRMLASQQNNHGKLWNHVLYT